MSHTMLYKAPGQHDIHGGKFDYKIVPDEQIDDALADGWHLTTPEAKQALEAEAAKALSDDTKPPTRDELEQMATKLGIAFSARTSGKRLRAQIEAATQPDAGTEG